MGKMQVGAAFVLLKHLYILQQPSGFRMFASPSALAQLHGEGAGGWVGGCGNVCV
jgi:hypothetical protein